MIFRPCRDEEAIKPWSVSFLPLDGFLFWRSFCCMLGRIQRRQRCDADGEGHLNKPSVEPGTRDRPVQSNLWLSSLVFPHWGHSSELLDLPNEHFLSPLSGSPFSPFPAPHFPPLFKYPFSFFHFSICYHIYIHLQIHWPAAHPDRVSIQAM